ncbi:hypothetical protein CDAR_309481 [Caerostris darwini]|uniref:Uncharacterized protein n=1 Tax=Caerostris darwini TaxID=1538125 RepID=A0AAV4SEK2_9ARAC|nr:hypothetical protein CDAR_309481 [Caerostris darwini]
MNEDLRRIHQCVEYITHEIESAILLTSNAFCHMEQAVNTHTTLDPGTLTADECRAREPETTFLINRLQKASKRYREYNGSLHAHSTRSEELQLSCFIV